MKPKRIQRKRTRGWKMPEGTVYVGRPSIFGNPYDVKRYGLDLSLALFAETARGCWNPLLIPEGPHEIRWSEWLYEEESFWGTEEEQVSTVSVSRGK